jgi:hypothetical protein
VVVIIDEPTKAGDVSAYTSGECLVTEFLEIGDTLLDGPILDA